MKEHPIIFNGPMVRAILEGRKTQTRRVMKPQVSKNAIFADYKTDLGYPASKGQFWAGFYLGKESIDPGYFKCSYGAPGDRLWVRETHRFTLAGKPKPPGYVDLIEYKADGFIGEIESGLAKDVSFRWRPSIHMPRSASRILLEVTDVRVERVQEITAEDTLFEGIELPMPSGCDIPGPPQGYEEWPEAKQNEWVEGQARATYFARCADLQNHIDAFKEL
jgi:hypothetical protein